MYQTGGPDDAYLPTLSALGQEELLGKLVLLHGSEDPAPEIQQLSFPSMRIDGLFIPGRSILRPRRLALMANNVSHMGSTSSHSTTGGGLTSPESEINSQAAGLSVPSPPTVTPGKPIDPSKVCHYQKLLHLSRATHT